MDKAHAVTAAILLAFEGSLAPQLGFVVSVLVMLLVAGGKIKMVSAEMGWRNASKNEK